MCNNLVMFKKMVIVEHINMLKEDIEKLNKYASSVTYFDDLPENDEVIINRIGDADCVLVSYTSKLGENILKECKNVKYIGMCCSLYSPESANVDIKYCESHGIVVQGIRDYGDQGVVEYIIHELVDFLGGYKGQLKWSEYPEEISSLKCAVIGLGTSGSLIAKTLKFFGADVSYFSRTRKEEVEKEIGITYKSLNDCVKDSDAIFLALNKNALVLKEEQFKLMSGKRILFNTSIGPGFEQASLEEWLKDSNHYFFGDTLATIGNNDLWNLPNTQTINRSSGGKTHEAYRRLGKKVIENIESFLNK